MLGAMLSARARWRHYLAPAPPVFDFEARRGVHIKRQHVIVGMTAKCCGDLDSLVLHEVHRRANVVDPAQLQHEMMQPLGAGTGTSASV